MKKSLLFLAMAAILLSSCFIPDNYEVEVWLHKDSSYEFFYNGELKYAPAIEKISKGEFGEKDIMDMFEMSDELSESEGFMEVDYKDNGVFEVDVIIAREPGESYAFISDDIDFFGFTYDEKGNLLFYGPEISDDDRDGLDVLGIDMEGVLRIIADKGVKVKSHNADKKKKLADKKVQYEWFLDVNSEQPDMVIKQ